MTVILIRKGEDTDPQRSDRHAKDCQLSPETGTESPSEPSEETNPTKNLILDFWPPEL